MTTPVTLTEEYIFAHDLRSASAKIYRASTKALIKHFRTTPVEEIDHRAIPVSYTHLTLPTSDLV